MLRPIKTYSNLLIMKQRGGHGVNMLNGSFFEIHNQVCKECHQPTLVYDQRHGEIFCRKCGLVHQEATLPRITQLIEESQKEYAERKTIMRKLKKQQHNQMLILNKHGNYLFNQWIYTYW